MLSEYPKSIEKKEKELLEIQLPPREGERKESTTSPFLGYASTFEFNSKKSSQAHDDGWPFVEQ